MMKTPTSDDLGRALANLGGAPIPTPGAGSVGARVAATLAVTVLVPIVVVLAIIGATSLALAHVLGVTVATYHKIWARA